MDEDKAQLAVSIADAVAVMQRRFKWAREKGLTYVAHAVPSPRPREPDVWWVRYHIPHGPTDSGFNVHVDLRSRSVILVYEDHA